MYENVRMEPFGFRCSVPITGPGHLEVLGHKLVHCFACLGGSQPYGMRKLQGLPGNENGQEKVSLFFFYFFINKHL